MPEDTSRKFYDFVDTAGVATGGGMPSSGMESPAASRQAGSTGARLGDGSRSADLAATAQEVARRAGEQASMATARAGEYLTRNINEYPLSALLLAGFVGYGLGYLIHTRWHAGWWDNRAEIEEGQSSTDGTPLIGVRSTTSVHQQPER
jgi:hypothetical protein